MRFLPLLMIPLFFASCDSMHALWHKATPEEIARQDERDRRSQEEADARGAEYRRQKAERQKKMDAIIQAFTLQDVQGCVRLALIREYSLDSARAYAVRAGGNRVLAQRRGYVSYDYDSKLNRYKRVRLADVDDYEVYRCDAPADPSSPAPEVTPPPVPAPPSAPPPESR